MPAERVQAPQEEEEEGFEPSSSLAAAPVAAHGLAAAGSGVMTGTYFHALDEKGRVIIPAKLRGALTEQFWMMLDESNNIGLYSYPTGMDILEHCERMMAEYPEDEDIADAVYRITSGSVLVDIESGFRVPIPEILRFYAGIEKDVVTEGRLNHAVIWEREKWQAERGGSDRRNSASVLKAQASLVRAAASGARRSPAQSEPARSARQAGEAADEQDSERASHERASLERDAERSPAAAERGAERGGRKAAPSGDGGRSPRLLTLSQLGR